MIRTCIRWGRIICRPQPAMNGCIGLRNCRERRWRWGGWSRLWRCRRGTPIPSCNSEDEDNDRNRSDPASPSSRNFVRPFIFQPRWNFVESERSYPFRKIRESGLRGGACESHNKTSQRHDKACNPEKNLQPRHRENIDFDAHGTRVEMLNCPPRAVLFKLARYPASPSIAKQPN